MAAFRIFLVAMWVVITGYTAIVAANHGLNVLPVFFGDIAKMGWPGQFNLDFLCMLLLSGFWVAWRHHFSIVGLVLGALTALVGAAVLSAYLLVISLQTKGNVQQMLLGTDRAGS